MNEALVEGRRLFEEGLYEQALYFLEDIDPIEEPQAAYFQALAYSKIGRAAEALKALDLVLIQETNFLKILQARMIQAFLLTTEKRYSEAENALRSMIEEGVESPQVYSNYGYVLWATGRGREGIAWLNTALKEDPDNANVMNSLAYILAEVETMLDKALTLAQRAVEASPRSVAYLDTLGWVYHKMGQEKLAHFHLKKAYDLQSDNEDVFAHLKIVETQLALRPASESMRNP